MAINSEEKIPTVGEQPTPLWIKIMWALGVAWVLIYIFQGLRHTPISW